MRRRPLLVVRSVVAVGIVLAAAGAAAAGYAGYVRHQRRAAEAALAADRPAEARGRLDRALALWPWDPELHRLAARAARLTGDFPAAEAHLNRCLKLSGGATEAVQIEYYLFRVQTGEIDRVASPLFAAVEAGHPDAPAILETLAKGYLQALRYKLAYGCLDRWLDLDPNAARAYMLRAFALEKLGNHKAAFADYLKALDADPDLLPARLRVAEMLLEDKKVDEARAQLDRLYRQAPDDPQVQARVGMGRFLEGRTADARRLMEAAVPHLPADPTLLITLAQLDIQQERGADAEARLRVVLKADPSDNEALHNLASALRLQGKMDEAADALREFERYKKLVDKANKLLQDVPDKEGATAADYHDLGTALLAIHRDRGAFWLTKALDKDPGHLPTLRALAAYYEGKGEAARAREYRDRARQAAPRP